MKNLITIAFLLLANCLFAQDDCAFHFPDYKPAKDDGSRYADFESDYQFAFKDADPVYGGSYKLNAVVHVLHNGGVENISDAQILNGIELTNEYLGENGTSEETGIRLELFCIKRLQVNNTAGYSSRPVDAGWRDISYFDRTKFVNIYIIPAFSNSNALGVASHPIIGSNGTFGLDGTPHAGMPLGDGVVVLHDAFGDIGTGNLGNGGVLVHELGHYLGLYHINGLIQSCAQTCADQTQREDWLKKGDRVGDTTPSFWNGLIAWCTTPKIDPCVGSCSGAVATGAVFPSDNLMTSATGCRSTFTAGQAKRMHFTLEEYRSDLWDSNDLPCPDMVITNNFTFGPGQHLVGSITVEDGASLTIPHDAVVRFCDQNSYLNIKTRGVVFADGILTSGCDPDWQGINVSGIDSRLYTTEGLITNALIGVSLKDGGTCIARSSMFLNNGISLEVNSTSKGAEIEDCAFIIDSEFQVNYFDYHMRIVDNSDPVKIRGGYFIDKLNPGSGQAINSYNGNYTIAPSFEHFKFGEHASSNRVRFTGFDHAIHATNNTTHTYQVEKSIFEDNNIAIYNNEVNASKITFNDFNIPPKKIGVMYHGPTVGLINQENNYMGQSGGDNIGVLTKSIGLVNQTIRRNIFDNLAHGGLANGLCGTDGIESRGLTYLCNINNRVEYDFAVADDPSTSLDQIRKVQGDFISAYLINAAGNKFYYDPTTGSDFFNDGDLGIDYHSRNVPNERIMTALGVTEIIEPINNYNCSQNVYIDFPPNPGPRSPLSLDSFIGMKEYVDATRQANRNPAVDTPVDYTFEQEEWDHFIPFLLNGVMTGVQDIGYSDFSNRQQFELGLHDMNVISWIYGHSLEADLSIVRILAENGDYTSAAKFIKVLYTNWQSHPQVLDALNDYIDILTIINNSPVNDLSEPIISSLVNDYPARKTAYGRSWTRSIAYLYGIEIPITFTLPDARYTALKKIEAAPSPIVMPNPFNQSFTIKNAEVGQLRIYDLLGRQVFTANTTEGSNLINFEGYESGIYLYQLVVNDEVAHTGRLIKL